MHSSYIKNPIKWINLEVRQASSSKNQAYNYVKADFLPKTTTNLYDHSTEQYCFIFDCYKYYFS